MMIVNTMPMPEKMAPATKYGGKIVVCQPGLIAIAKSNDTTECTESTSGVLKAARKRYILAKCRHSGSEFRHPNDRTARIFLRTGLVHRSRSTAMSGMRPTYRKVLEIVRYVEIAKTSQMSGLLKFGQSRRPFANGIS